MSVLACDRKGCRNIMCSMIVLDNYICNDCWEELMIIKESLGEEATEVEIKDVFMKFLATEPGTHKRVNVEEEFERVLQVRSIYS